MGPHKVKQFIDVKSVKIENMLKTLYHKKNLSFVADSGLVIFIFLSLDNNMIGRKQICIVFYKEPETPQK